MKNLQVSVALVSFVGTCWLTWQVVTLRYEREFVKVITADGYLLHARRFPNGTYAEMGRVKPDMK